MLTYVLRAEDDGLAVREDADGVARHEVLLPAELHRGVVLGVVVGQERQAHALLRQLEHAGSVVGAPQSRAFLHRRSAWWRSLRWPHLGSLYRPSIALVDNSRLTGSSERTTRGLQFTRGLVCLTEFVDSACRQAKEQKAVCVCVCVSEMNM
jgi:hypothetical protein